MAAAKLHVLAEDRLALLRQAPHLAPRGMSPITGVAFGIALCAAVYAALPEVAHTHFADAPWMLLAHCQLFPALVFFAAALSAIAARCGRCAW